MGKRHEGRKRDRRLGRDLGGVRVGWVGQKTRVGAKQLSRDGDRVGKAESDLFFHHDYVNDIIRRVCARLPLAPPVVIIMLIIME
jgi:hypothetical protein